MPINYEAAKTLIKGLVQKMKSFRGNWEQNDPTADDYIKNRPFYTEEAEIVILPETTINSDSVIITSPLVVGQEYKITWNGVVYSSIARNYEGYRMIGNNAVYKNDNGIEDNTGEPFAAVTNGDALELFFYMDDTVTEHPVVSITTFGEKVHRIDEKYIPDIFAYKDDVIQNPENADFGQVLVATGISDKTGRPQWEPWDVFNSDGRLHMDMLPSGYPTLGDYGRFSVSNLLFENLSNSNNFNISLTNSAYIKVYRNSNGIKLFFTGTSKDTKTVVSGDKFSVYIPEILDTCSSATNINTCGKNLMLSSNNSQNAVHIHDIDNKPVVTFASGHIERDGTPLYDVQVRLRNVEAPLENYDAANKVYVDSSFDIVNDVIYIDNFSATPTIKDGKAYATYTVLGTNDNVRLTPNTKYHVIFQNTHYDCMSYITEIDGLSYVVIGNGEIFGSNGGDSEPFAFSQLYELNDTSPKDVTLITQSDGTYNISLAKTGYKQILEKYVPTTIPRTATASVGQTIVVKAVDDSGKPTEWEVVDMPVGIPTHTSADEGKILRIVNGTPTWTTIPNAEEVSF